MRVSQLWVPVFLFVGTALIFLSSISCTTPSSTIPDMAFTHYSSRLVMATRGRKLKENAYTRSSTKKRNGSNMNLEDYLPVDPAPTTKTSVRPGPIEHGSPLNPYIPKPPPTAPPLLD